MKRKLFILGLAAAMLLSGCGGGSVMFGRSILYTRAAADDEVFDQSVRNEDLVLYDESVSLSGLPEEEETSDEEPLPDEVPEEPVREMPVFRIEGSDYVGYIDIPALQLTLPVMESWSYPNLKIAPCRYTGSVYYDNMVIAAHNYEEHFGGLKELAAGDAVRFIDGDGNVFFFQVSLLEQLGPEQVEEMTESEWALSLFTCTDDGQERLTVRCSLDEGKTSGIK